MSDQFMRRKAKAARGRALRVVLAALIVGAVLPAGGVTSAEGEHIASGWEFVKFPAPQPVCDGLGFGGSAYFDRLDCGFGYVLISGTNEDSHVTIRLIGSDGKQIEEQDATFVPAEDGVNRPGDTWEYRITPETDWPAGNVTVDALVGDVSASGTGEFFLNMLVADIEPPAKPDGSLYRPGEPLRVTGTVSELDSGIFVEPNKTGVPATFSLRVVTPKGQVRGPYGPFTAGDDGTFDAELPGAATQGLSGSAESQFKVTVSVEVVDASYEDPITGGWAAERAGAAAAVLRGGPKTLLVESSFVSDVGWVKPGERYPFRVFVKNYTAARKRDAVVRLPAVDGAAFVRAVPTKGSGSASIGDDGAITWNVGDVPAGTDAAPTVRTLIVEGRARTLGEDARVAWKDISATAVLSYAGLAGPLRSTSHGPKVIPPGEIYETARYGDRPFPVVPADYHDRKHQQGHTGQLLADKINSPSVEGSTFNLYQEMSYGQLHPNGTVPSAAIATAGWDVEFKSPRYRESGFVFTDLQPRGTCTGVTYKDVRDTPLYPERIQGGWYQLPGDTQYYGGDRVGTAILAAGSPVVGDIDSACGPTGKAVYDAAMIADPEIDYSDYDTDKDGVVDFFMMVFVGLGGNGPSQLFSLLDEGTPPYDNIWPHSSSLEFTYVDSETGLRGYISDDQLRDLEGRPLYYSNQDRTSMTTKVTSFPVYVRVGPYNVNPESAIDQASVISHEYGHSLGLPDFYRTSGPQTYGTWNLMAADYSQHMDVFAKQELGWIVPRVLKQGTTVVRGWRDSKANTHRIDWVTPNGKPYTLSGPGVNNGEAYVAKLPSRRVIDQETVAAGASPPHVWWSGSGNDFGCPPLQGHNLDVYLPELAKVPSGTTVTATFSSNWDIEWDFDYGFVLLSTDGGKNYASLPSENGYTTPAAINPNSNGCQQEFGNGITGSSGSYAAGTQNVDRLGDPAGLGIRELPDPVFLEDSYDLSAAAGKAAVLRFSYSTDPGLARPGWFIDDLTVKAGDDVIYQSDFEQADDLRLYNGGCREDLRVAATCTDGWAYVSASEGSPADHAYFMEMRDRSGFDFDGHGQSDRGDITFLPGLLLVYADENHGYGNFGVDDPPAQTPVDSQPQPGPPGPGEQELGDVGLGAPFPNLDDAGFTAAEGDNAFSNFGAGYKDNYTDPASEDGLWYHRFDCLSLEVLRMSGDDVGPATAPGNLVGDVRIKTGGGCGRFNHGFGVPNLPPIPIIQLKPAKPVALQSTRFDGTRSYDDFDAASRLRYAWDFQGDGRIDAAGASAAHVYPAPGRYRVVLKVTDSEGRSSTTEKMVTVSGVLGTKELPATGTSAWPAALGAFALGVALLGVRSLRRGRHV